MNTQVFYDFGCENKKVIESQWDKLSQPFIPNYSTEGYPLTIAEANGLNKKITTIELNYSTLHFNFAKVIHFTLHTNKESIGIVCETEQGNYYTLKSNLLVDVIQGGGMSKQSHTYKTSWGQPVEVFAIRCASSASSQYSPRPAWVSSAKQAAGLALNASQSASSTMCLMTSA